MVIEFIKENNDVLSSIDSDVISGVIDIPECTDEIKISW